MSIPDFAPGGRLPAFDAKDWQFLKETQVENLSKRIDNAVRLDDARITISRDAAWTMHDIEVRVNASKEFSVNDVTNPTSEFGVMFLPKRDDETDYVPPAACIVSTYSSAEGFKLEIGGDANYDSRCAAEMCLYAGQIARAGIIGQANPDSLRQAAVSHQLSFMYRTIQEILNSEPCDAFEIVNGFSTPAKIRNEAIRKMPFDTLDLLKRTRLGALLIYRRVHLGVAIEGDTTLSIFTSISHLENGQDEQCHYRRIYTPSIQSSDEDSGKSFSYLTIIDGEPQPLMITEETDGAAADDVEPIDESISLFSQEAADGPITEVLTRPALYGDYRRIKPELLVLHDKYGI